MRKHSNKLILAFLKKGRTYEELKEFSGLDDFRLKDLIQYGLDNNIIKIRDTDGKYVRVKTLMRDKKAFHKYVIDDNIMREQLHKEGSGLNRGPTGTISGNSVNNNYQEAKDTKRWNAKLSKQLTEELQELRKRKDTPGFNDYDHGAMK